MFKNTLPTNIPDILPDDINTVMNDLKDMKNRFPIDKSYILSIIVLSAVHVIVSLGLLLLSFQPNMKDGFVQKSKLFWFISLLVCITILVLASVQFIKIKKIDDDYNEIKNILNKYMK